MKKLLISAVFGLLSVWSVTAQITTDTTIYDAPESLPYPMLNMCAPDLHPGWTADSARTCGELNLMRLMSRNVRYPIEARENNIQGTIVAQAIIEPNGRMSQIKIIKEIGGGCGDEALRILTTLDSLGLRWMPGLNNGKPVRSRKALPFRFRLTEALPYYLNDQGDTIYSNIDRQPFFKTGNDSLYAFIINRLEYPKSYTDSCKSGVIEYSLLIKPSGAVNIETQIDFNNLGSDFQFNGIQLVKKTKGLWQPALYKDQPVPAITSFRVVFHSDAPGCKAANNNFDKAMLLSDEAIVLSDSSKTEAAILKCNEALALDPGNTEILYYRGTLLLNNKQNEAACLDYNRIKEILGYTWFEQIRKLVCGW